MQPKSANSRRQCSDSKRLSFQKQTTVFRRLSTVYPKATTACQKTDDSVSESRRQRIEKQTTAYRKADDSVSKEADDNVFEGRRQQFRSRRFIFVSAKLYSIRTVKRNVSSRVTLFRNIAVMSRTSLSKSALIARFILLLGFLAATSLAFAINRPKDHPNRTDRRHRGRSSTPPPNVLCPVVACQELPADCKTVEYLVMQFNDQRSGQVISCQSCNYCLDLPRLPSSSRQRRDLIHRLFFDETNSKEDLAISCPAVPDSCSDVRMTRTWVSGQSTGPWSVTHCPACFDNTLNNRRHRWSAERRSPLL